MTFVPLFITRYKAKRKSVTWGGGGGVTHLSLWKYFENCQAGESWFAKALNLLRDRAIEVQKQPAAEENLTRPDSTLKSFKLWRMFWRSCVVWASLPFTNSDVVQWRLLAHSALWHFLTSSPISDPKLQHFVHSKQAKINDITFLLWCQKAKYLFFFSYLLPLAPSSEGKTRRSGWVFFF